MAPWLGAPGIRRALVAVPLGIALATSGLIQDEAGVDFFLLENDPIVVVVLIVLIGLVAFALAQTDEWLDARLPHPTADHPMASVAYPIITLLGAVIILPIVVASYFLPGIPAVMREGIAILVVGLATLTWWVLRVRGLARPPAGLMAVARGALLIAAALGVAAAIPGIDLALGR